jgi:hypothetical protein
MISEIIKKHGAASLAKKLNESIQTVNNWVKRGVPLDKAVAFCDAVNYEISPHKMYPKQYPHPMDGLPDHLRLCAIVQDLPPAHGPECCAIQTALST